jgi:Dyp-type peroxidase family
MDLSKTFIDPTTPEVRSMMARTQCNILKSHGRDFTVHLFLRFTGDDAAQTRSLLGEVATKYVTSAWKQYEESEAWTKDRTPGGLVGSLLLTASGYEALGFDPQRFDETDGNSAFRGGMKRRGFDLFGTITDTSNKDPDPEAWEAGYQDEIHAMFLLADEEDFKDRLAAAEQDVRDRLAPVAQVVHVEYGNTLRNERPKAAGKAEPERKGQPIEHFGYVDGRSNPLFFQSDIEADRIGGGTDEWDPSAALELVLVHDPLVEDVEDTASCGSYLVFRKLEQNVEGFELGVRDLASKLGMAPDLAGAMVVGRFKDGTPLALSGVDGLHDLNNFNYADADRGGGKCPFHAHVRKVNPRGTTPFTCSGSERSRRIARRGIPYGGKVEDGPPPREGVGLLFMCYQADINHQFEFIQRTWADNPNFPRNLILPDTGDDPLIGQDSDANAAQKWPTAWNGNERKRLTFGGYVTLKGGEYFFAPSITFLESL